MIDLGSDKLHETAYGIIPDNSFKTGVPGQIRIDTHMKLEQLERLRSEDTPRRLMITNTIESYWILSQKYNRSRTENVTERTRFQNQGRTTLKI